MEFNLYKIHTLAKNHTWLSLLYYDKDTKVSSVMNKDFFLSPLGYKNPILELKETIKAYDVSEKNELHPICKFPARYKWLSEHIILDDYKKINKKCTTLKKWNINQNVDSLSMVFVSGFLGNPASAFGHSFLKINKLNEENNDLLDTTISYGAQLPKKYTMLSYMYNGLTGGYQGSYSDKYYYMDDIVYSNQEFREMWEYKLALSQKNVEFLLMHLWELRGVKFQYYFFNKNCGYKGAELLELVYNKDLKGKAYVWYAPIETFFRLKEMEKASGSTIFKDIKYIPSQQQKIYTLYNSFSDAHRSLITNLLKYESELEIDDFKYLTNKEKIKILDFLLEYYGYKNINKNADSDSRSNVFQKIVLLKRLSLPVYAYRKKEPYMKKDITLNDKSNFIGFGYSDSSVLLEYAPFAIESVGYNQYSGDILKIMNGTIGLSKDKIFLKKLDIIKIRRLKTDTMPFDIESPYSWSLHLGLENKSKIDYFFDLGIGYSWKFSPNIKVYSMIHASLHSDNRTYRINPNIGMYIDFDKFRLNVDYGYENMQYKNIFNEKFSIKSQYKINSEFSLFLNVEKKETKNIEFGLKWYL